MEEYLQDTNRSLDSLQLTHILLLVFSLLWVGLVVPLLFRPFQQRIHREMEQVRIGARLGCLDLRALPCGWGAPDCCFNFPAAHSPRNGAGAAAGRHSLQLCCALLQLLRAS